MGGEEGAFWLKGEGVGMGDGGVRKFGSRVRMCRGGGRSGLGWM